jgi:hypothetical protein
MDGAGFKLWLASIPGLTAEQRGHGFRALAMAEAGEDTCTEIPAPPASLVSSLPAVLRPTHDDPVSEISVTPDEAGNAVPAASVADTVSLAAAGQKRVDRTGCPHCGSQKLQRWGHASGLPRYRCVDCRRSFNALTGTPLARLRKKEQWAAQTQALITGESLVKAGQALQRRRYHRVPLAPSVSGGSGARQTEPSHRDCRSRRDLHPGIVQGQARRPAAAGA